MAEGNETPQGEPPRPSDRDLLAERRARRAVDLEPTEPTDALIRRAEAAEATVQTLETHLTSLREQVREGAEERLLFVERLDAERAAVAEHEHELRLVKQREYAEQQQRVEAEDRRARLERDSRAEIDFERAARERAERQLASMREAHRRIERLVAELKVVALQLRAAAARSAPEQPKSPVTSEPREELADALAAAVERLRARAVLAQEPPAEPVSVPVPAPVAERSSHKHSMSLLTRLRIRRKQRRSR